jgi:hypothetical protein
MKHVHVLAIIGTPVVTADKINCPHCARALTVYSDGSAFCANERKHFQPEISDSELFARRLNFDALHNISTSSRVLAVHHAILGPSMRQHYWQR